MRVTTSGSIATPPSSAGAAPVTPHRPEEGAFGWTFWMLNAIEAFERLAYFGIRAVVPIYIMQATEPGGLHLTALHKGLIYAWWAIFQSWLPMVTGGYADRFGYKRTLTFAISMNVVGYVLMAYLPSYGGFFAGILVLATGTAFFKPALQGSLAQKLHKDNASMGWGIFYWVVNVGAFGAPFLATLILGKPHSAEGWRLVGYLLVEPSQSRFLKMTDPGDVLERELPNFRALAASFREGGAPADGCALAPSG